MIINRKYEVITGILKGYKGNLVAYDSITDEVEIQIDDISVLIISGKFLKLVE